MMTGLYPGPETGEYFHAVSEYYHISTNVISILSAWQPPGLGEAIMTTGLAQVRGVGAVAVDVLDLTAQFSLLSSDLLAQTCLLRPASSDAEKS